LLSDEEDGSDLSDLSESELSELSGGENQEEEGEEMEVDGEEGVEDAGQPTEVAEELLEDPKVELEEPKEEEVVVAPVEPIVEEVVAEPKEELPIVDSNGTEIEVEPKLDEEKKNVQFVEDPDVEMVDGEEPEPVAPEEPVEPKVEEPDEVQVAKNFVPPYTEWEAVSSFSTRSLLSSEADSCFALFQVCTSRWEWENYPMKWSGSTDPNEKALFELIVIEYLPLAQEFYLVGPFSFFIPHLLASSFQLTSFSSHLSGHRIASCRPRGDQEPETILSTPNPRV